MPTESIEVVRRNVNKNHSNLNMSDLTVYSRLTGKLALMYVVNTLSLQLMI